jgi:hypothetical protein
MYATERFQLYASDVLIPSFEQGIWQSENSLLTEPQFKKCLQAQALSLPIQQEKQMLQVSNFPFETGLERPYYFIFLNGQKAYVKNIEFKPNSKKNMLISRKWLMQVGVANMQNVHMEHGKYQIFLFDATNQRFWKMNQTFTH